MNTVTRFERFAAVTILSVSVASVASLAHAADSLGIPQSTVKYHDLVISSPQGAEALYHRIAGAARNVCHPLELRGVTNTMRYDACVKQAILEAVSKVGEPALAAVYSARYPQGDVAIRVASR